MNIHQLTRPKPLTKKVASETDKQLAEKTIHFLNHFNSGKTLLIFSNGRNWEPMDKLPLFFIALVKDNCVRILEET